MDCQYLLKKKKFQIKEIWDIVDFVSHDSKSPSMLAGICYAFGEIALTWKACNPKGEIWYYDDMMPLSGTKGLILVDEGLVVNQKVIWMS